MAGSSWWNMVDPDPASDTALRQAGLKVTPARRLAYQTLFADPEPRHWHAWELSEAMTAQGMRCSLATVYNTLESFAEAGLLKKIQLDARAAVFDTETRPHLHLVFEDEERVLNLHDEEAIQDILARYVDEPSNMDVDVIIKVRRKSNHA
jgi:Fur family iron response transcriptional regulator